MDLVVDDGAEPIQQQRKKQGEAISRIEEEKLGIRDLRFGINVTQRREATVEHGIGKRGKPRGPPPSAMQSESVVGIGDSRTLCVSLLHTLMFRQVSHKTQRHRQ
ncbi:PREDICTED: uncharacterized protein LOC106343348 [Brassica oleracea var. oleracea]|uniref:uncharacterized protein LOC106343348 n=1 Tax=Brassica oleracea var. oleracea TaxID=109376 RepID=UPI0006A6BC62|nr:PREDICTED: uncharacterized protein LOC106343348 [Brassica oleracea var. oleracea]